MVERIDSENYDYGQNSHHGDVLHQNLDISTQLAMADVPQDVAGQNLKSENLVQIAAATTAGDQAAPGSFSVEKVTTYDPAAVKQQIIAEDGIVIDIPADNSVSAILVNGNDIIIREANGDLILVKDGLKHLPTLHIGNIEVPSAALSASLTANGVTLPAAGDTGAQNANAKSSGGQFGPDAGNIGDPFHIRDLLPFSDLNREFGDHQNQIGLILMHSPPVIISIDGTGNPLIVPDPALLTGTSIADCTYRCDKCDHSGRHWHSKLTHIRRPIGNYR